MSKIAIATYFDAPWLFCEGVVLVEDYFTDEELEAVKRDIEKGVAKLAAALYVAGKIKSEYTAQSYPPSHRGTVGITPQYTGPLCSQVT